jgi:hypothetical protein
MANTPPLYLQTIFAVKYRKAVIDKNGMKSSLA